MQVLVEGLSEKENCASSGVDHEATEEAVCRLEDSVIIMLNQGR